MSNRPIPLTQLRIPSPCTRDWDAMTPDGTRRLCGECNKHVHDLTQMTTADAQRLLATRTGRLCVRYGIDADGQVQTLDYAPPRRPRYRTWVWLPAALLGSVAAAVAHAFYVVPKQPPPVRMMLGDVAAPAQPPAMVVKGEIGPACPTSRPTTNPTK